ncbi:MAG: S49 family peptidase [Parasphingorhabdus sp.]|uniref:S49 family peptidase n=1 Tax=Parasphingorhabdus sp. TaxID=2709688 RepID=UPI003296BA5A
MNNRILAAIRSQPWAIMPEYLDAIEAIAMRAIDHPSLAHVEADGHEQRYISALAQMGSPLTSTKTVMFRNGVASMPVFGPLIPRGSGPNVSAPLTSLDTLAKDFRAISEVPEVHAILMVFDTPGGHVTDIRSFADMIASSKIPVHGHITGDCASGGYWVGSQCKKLTIDPTGRAGSIGVMVGGRHQEETDSDGCRDINIISSNAPNKRVDITTEEGQANIRAMLDGIEEIFLKDVARGRGVSVSTVKQDFGAGGILTGRQAKEAGLVDQVEAGGLEAVLNRLSKPARTVTPRRAAAALSNEVAQLRAASNL